MRSISPVFSPPAGRASPRLFDAIPAMRGAVPWRPLCHLPTAVEPCDAIADALGGARVWAKRDDLVSPVYGGNKVRRFEFVFADLEARGARRIVTTGGVASTQVTATSLFGQALGIPVRAVLFDQPVTRFAREAVLTDLAAGAELIAGGGYVTSAWRTWRALRDDPGARLLLPGASHPLANLGYLDAMLELDAQVRAGAMPRPDVIVVPAGSSGTLAALSLGGRVARLGHRGRRRPHRHPRGVQPRHRLPRRRRHPALRRALRPRLRPPPPALLALPRSHRARRRRAVARGHRGGRPHGAPHGASPAR